MSYTDRDIIYIYDTSLKLVKRCINARQALKFLEVAPKFAYTVLKEIDSGRLYDRKYYLSTGSIDSPSRQNELDTLRVELFPNNPCKVYLYEAKSLKKLRKFKNKLAASKSLVCPVPLLEYFIDKNRLFKGVYFLFSHRPSIIQKDPNIDEANISENTQLGTNSSTSSDADDESSDFSDSAVDEGSSSFSTLKESDELRESGFFNPQEDSFFDLNSLRNLHQRRTTLPKEEPNFLPKKDSMELPNEELLEAINQFARKYYLENGLSNILGHMDGTALTALGM
ncbi:hypothetical protein G9A89_014984 [Geosiphon pyriformis]|nr:hypothetical protein G9A89_014984 [Geosiphon pyriformis]